MLQIVYRFKIKLKLFIIILKIKKIQQLIQINLDNFNILTPLIIDIPDFYKDKKN
jgi:hypothetical protein